MIDGRDVSELNGDLSSGWFAAQGFVIVRAFNEHGRIDARLTANLARSQGVTLRGVYGWPIAGDDNYQLGRALGIVAGQVELGAWADYELGGRQALPTQSDLLDYLRGIESTGAVAGFYSNRSEYPSWSALDQYPWWFANPSNLDAPRPPTIVQYGIVDGVDADRATEAALLQLQRIQPAPPIGDDDMPVIVFGQDHAGHSVAYLCQGGRALATWDTNVGQFGIPAGATDYIDKHPGTPLVLVTPADLARVVVP